MEQLGQDVVATGSTSRCHALIAADPGDEYRLFVHPVVPGRGRRLFPDGFELTVWGSETSITTLTWASARPASRP
jgi:dihydrofolate reductase